MILLFDVGNTHTHVGLANRNRVVRQIELDTHGWRVPAAEAAVRRFTRGARIERTAVCSVVPRATAAVRRVAGRMGRGQCLELSHRNLVGVGIDYPAPETIGADRLANAVAIKHHYGAPSLVVDFGTAVSFDVVDCSGNYVGGVIAPGLEVMTEYLHTKTALLPQIRIRDTKEAIGKNTEHAMRIGAVHGYRGLVRALIQEIRRELKARRLPVVATGGYAALMAAGLPEIIAVEPALTLEGLRLVAVASL